MRILAVHERYQQPGGEDTVFDAEKDMLLRAGHTVTCYVRHNDEIARYKLAQKALLPVRTLWATDACRDIDELLEKRHPEVAHFHNTFPLISPGAYYACQRAGVPVVQTLHNPRLMCPAATLYRDGHVCQDCLGKLVQWPAVLHACYRESRAETGVVTAMLSLHRGLRTWRKQVDIYIASTEFYRKMFIQAGLPAERILIKPHFVAQDPGAREGCGNYALFIGRLAPEKGVSIMLDAWSQLRHIPLRIRGDGPLLVEIQNGGNLSHDTIQIVPRLSKPEMIALIKGARFLVWPSQGYYETFGLVAIEAFACGVPVIGSGIGAMAEVVAEGRTGLLFKPGNAEDLAAKVEWAWTHHRELEVMGRNARAEYEAKYTSDANYEQLIKIYQRAACTAV